MALVLHGKRFLSVPEAAERLGVTRLTVYRWVRGIRRAPPGVRVREVIRDTRSNQAYIPEELVRRLVRVFRQTKPHARRSRR